MAKQYLKGWVGGIAPSVTSGATATLDGSTSNVLAIVLTANVALTIQNIKAGCPYTIVVTQDATGSRAFTIASGSILESTDTDQSPNPAALSVTVYNFIGLTATSLIQVSKSTAVSGWTSGLIALGTGAAGTVDGDLGNVYTLTANANYTLTIGRLRPGMTYTVSFTQDGTGSRTLTIAGGTVTAPTTATIAPTAGAGTVTHIQFVATGAATALLTQKLA